MERQYTLYLTHRSIAAIHKTLDSFNTPKKRDDGNLIEYSIIDHLYISEGNSEGKHEAIVVIHNISYTPEQATTTPEESSTLPAEWDEGKIQQLIGAYLATSNIDNSLKAINLSSSQDNRRFAHETLKQQGILKEK